jgi:hypothetical protein
MHKDTKEGIFDRLLREVELRGVGGAAEGVVEGALRDLEATARQGLRDVRGDLMRMELLRRDPQAAVAAAVSMFEQVGPGGAAVSAVNVLNEATEKPKPRELAGLTLEVLGACFLVVPGAKAASLLGRCFIGAGFTRDALTVLRPGSKEPPKS